MNRRAVESAKAEAARFIGKCDELLDSTEERYVSGADGYSYVISAWDGGGSIKSATVRRASMDLTRELAKLRKR